MIESNADGTAAVAVRPDGQLRHAPASPWSAARAPRLGRRRQRIPRPARRHRGQRTRPRPPGRRRGRHRSRSRRLGHISNLYINRAHGRTRRAAARRLPGCPATARCSSATPAPRPTRPRSRSPGSPAGTAVVAADGAFHGRTMGALALTGQPAKRDPVRAAVPGVTPRAVRRRRRAALGRRRDTDRRRLPGTGPRRGGVIAAPDGYLAGRPRDHHAGRRPAGARRGADRHRPHRALVRLPAGRRRARRDHPGQGPRRRPPAGRGHRHRPGGDLFQPGQHGTTFGGNPVCCAAGLAVLRTIAADELSNKPPPSARTSPAGIEALGHPLVSGVRGAGLLLGVTLRRAGRQDRRGRSAKSRAT